MKLNVKCTRKSNIFFRLSTLRESFLGEVVSGHFQEASEPFLKQWWQGKDSRTRAKVDLQKIHCNTKLAGWFAHVWGYLMPSYPPPPITHSLASHILSTPHPLSLWTLPLYSIPLNRCLSIHLISHTHIVCIGALPPWIPYTSSKECITFHASLCPCVLNLPATCILTPLSLQKAEGGLFHNLSFSDLSIKWTSQFLLFSTYLFETSTFLFLFCSILFLFCPKEWGKKSWISTVVFPFAARAKKAKTQGNYYWSRINIL